MHQLPTNSHDWALWLFEHLERVECVGANWQGYLPLSFDFQITVEAIPTQIRGLTDLRDRTIEFHPELGNVYQDMTALVQGPRQRMVPAMFTVRDLDYTHGKTETVPDPICNYLNTVKLWQLLRSFADYEVGQFVAFIKSYDSKIEIRPEYNASDLVSLPNLAEFEEVYFETEHHREEKRNIVRATILEVFNGLMVVRFAELLPKYCDLVDRIKISYTMYTADFSFEKLRSEVDTKNVEDMLRLNKTLADIQNQLLALPAALLIAGASVKPNSIASNLTIWLGITVFVWVMDKLLANQQNSVLVIKQEAQLRIDKVAVQPADISNRILPMFTDLQTRLERQSKTLQKIGFAVWGVWLAVTLVAINAQWPDILPFCLNWFVDMAREVCGHLLR